MLGRDLGMIVPGLRALGMVCKYAGIDEDLCGKVVKNGIWRANIGLQAKTWMTHQCDLRRKPKPIGRPMAPMDQFNILGRESLGRESIVAYDCSCVMGRFEQAPPFLSSQ
jgi:hypothetical protein